MKYIAVMGAGNVGLYAAKAVSRSGNMELCGFIRRAEETVPGFEDIPVVSAVEKLPRRPDGVLICVPSERSAAFAKSVLTEGINTVDAFDIHETFGAHKNELYDAAVKNSAVAVVGAGWDPGLDDTLRRYMALALPESDIQTSFGPGMSMGHSSAAKAVAGVVDAVSLTVPMKNGAHKRLVYIQKEPFADEERIRSGIKASAYFSADETEIFFEEDISPRKNSRHGVYIDCDGEDGQWINFEMRINNPYVTGNLMAAAMGASFLKNPGVYEFSELLPRELSFFI